MFLRIFIKSEGMIHPLMHVLRVSLLREFQYIMSIWRYCPNALSAYKTRALYTTTHIRHTMWINPFDKTLLKFVTKTIENKLLHIVRARRSMLNAILFCLCQPEKIHINEFFIPLLCIYTYMVHLFSVYIFYFTYGRICICARYALAFEFIHQCKTINSVSDINRYCRYGGAEATQQGNMSRAASNEGPSTHTPKTYSLYIVVKFSEEFAVANWNTQNQLLYICIYVFICGYININIICVFGIKCSYMYACVLESELHYVLYLYVCVLLYSYGEVQ